MRIILETEECQFVIETDPLDPAEGVDAQGETWTRQGPPLNLPGEVWVSAEEGVTSWRK